jgi:hypothetical protein
MDWADLPPITGPGFDLDIMWRSGLALLNGQNPYALPGAAYPPAMLLLFAVLALLPWSVVLWTVTGLNVMALVALKGRSALVWLAFVPVLHVIVSGQVSLFFVLLIPLLWKGGWRAAVAVALFTLKPQLAIVALPFFVVRWMLTADGRWTLAKAAAISIGLLLLPLAVRPTLYSEYLAVSGAATAYKWAGAGIWNATALPTWLLAAVGAALGLLALITNRYPVSRSALALGAPMFSYYDTVFLMDCGPAWLLVPVSWAALGLSHAVGSYLPFAGIPLAAFVWTLAAGGFNGQVLRSARWLEGARRRDARAPVREVR